jgi:hypothetical protein
MSSIVPPPLLKILWYIKDIKKYDTLLGVEIQAWTSIPVHLQMVYTTTQPELEQRWKMKRGIKVHCDPVFHLLNPVWVDEDFPIADFWHKWTITDWPVCQTRWWFFAGQFGLFYTKSQSPLFEYHKQALPQEYVFLPQRDPGTTSSDGYCGRTTSNPGRNWGDMHDGAGNMFSCASPTMNVGIHCGSGRDWYTRIYRGAALFDTSGLPRPGIALEAWVLLWCNVKNWTYEWPWWRIALTGYDQEVNGAIQKSDYGRYMLYLDSHNTIDYDDIVVGAYNRLTVATSYLPLFREHPIAEFGIREYGYDYQDIAPEWGNGRYQALQFLTREDVSGHWPELHILWLQT